MKRKEFGTKSEHVAASYLRAHGYQIEAVNWRQRSFEIDIIARKGQKIAFVEVKSSTADPMGPPQLRVTKSKQKRIVAAATQYIASLDAPFDEVSFDIIAIMWPEGKAPQIEHLESAFRAEAT